MLTIMIALFVVSDNLQIVIIRYFFAYYISLFRNQNLNIKKKLDYSSQYLNGKDK